MHILCGTKHQNGAKRSCVAVAGLAYTVTAFVTSTKLSYVEPG